MLNIRGLWLSIFPFVALARLQPSDFSAGVVPTASHSLIDGKPQHPSALLAKQNDTNPFKGVKYHSGYINVGNENGEMFYWYFPREKRGSTTNKTENTPVILWLSGGTFPGPGCSSEVAALSENGPFSIQPNGTLIRNPQSWSTVADVVYVDQLLGTGFSFLGNSTNYVIDEDVVAEDTREFLVQFIEKYPNLKNRRFFLAGEYYAGHYIPSVGHLLLKSPIEGLNFVGVAIGNGWIDPKSQYPAYADFALENKMVGQVAYYIAKQAIKSCVTSIDEGEWGVATAKCYAITSLLLGQKNPYDIRLDCKIPPFCYDTQPLTKFMNRDDVQRALGVHTKNGEWVECDPFISALSLGDWVMELRAKMEELLKAGKQILVYNGDKDFLGNWRGGEAWVNNMEWEKQDEFRSKPYSTWEVNGKPSGAIRKVDNLTFLRVFDAGHMVPMDQPEAALAMITSFLTNNFTMYSELSPGGFFVSRIVIIVALIIVAFLSLIKIGSLLIPHDSIETPSA